VINGDSIFKYGLILEVLTIPNFDVNLLKKVVFFGNL